MRWRFRNGVGSVLTVITLVAVAGACAPASPTLRTEGATPAATVPQWTTTWGAAVQQAASGPADVDRNWSEEGFADQTLRQVFRVSVGGTKLRLRLSNAYGTKPLHIAGATLARSDGGPKARPGTIKELTFRGARATTVPVGRDLLTDALPFPTSALEKLTVSLRFDRPTGPATVHRFTTATSYRAPGDHLRTVFTDAFDRNTSYAWYYLTAAEVTGRPRTSTDQRAALLADTAEAPPAPFARPVPPSFLVFGDSLIDGVGTTPGTDNRFSDKLAERLLAARRPQGAVNAGLAGDSLLRDSPCYGEKALTRFEKTLREHPDLRTVFIHIGANDLATTGPDNPCMQPHPPVTARRLIDAHRTLIRQAHAHGLKAVGMTILPVRGAVFPFTDAAGDKVRQELNTWIRTSGAYDTVLDAAQILTDPTTGRTAPGYVSEDGLHPSDAGYAALASAVNLNDL